MGRSTLKSLMVSAFAASTAWMGASGALAAEGGHAEIKKHDWTFERPIGAHFEQGAVQRGFQIYKEVCSSCHTMKQLSYRNLGEPGGPFMAHGVLNRQTNQWEEVEFGPPHHKGVFIPSNENPYVRAIAEEYEITEIDPTTGQEITRPAKPSDRFKSPYSNPYEAAAIHGVAPPDLSVITKARHGGADYLVAFLTGYADPPAGVTPPAENLYYNKAFPGHWVSMAPQLIPDRVTYSDGTPATPEQMARDVATFLAWASEPKQIERKQIGFVTIAFLLVLTGFLYAAYRQVWRDVKH